MIRIPLTLIVIDCAYLAVIYVGHLTQTMLLVVVALIISAVCMSVC